LREVVNAEVGDLEATEATRVAIVGPAMARQAAGDWEFDSNGAPSVALEPQPAKELVVRVGDSVRVFSRCRIDISARV